MLQMKLCGDLVLREKCASVERLTPEILANLDEMVKMMDTEKGVGLAAPQVGILQRFLVMINPDTKEVLKMINPRIVSKSEKTISLEEGCLSVVGSDGLPLYAYVERPESVSVEWVDENGVECAADMTGMASRIVQHEADHLDGILFIDYLPAVKREMVMRKLRKRK